MPKDPVSELLFKPCLRCSVRDVLPLQCGGVLRLRYQDRRSPPSYCSRTLELSRSTASMLKSSFPEFSTCTSFVKSSGCAAANEASSHTRNHCGAMFERARIDLRHEFGACSKNTGKAPVRAVFQLQVCRKTFEPCDESFAKRRLSPATGDRVAM